MKKKLRERRAKRGLKDREEDDVLLSAYEGVDDGEEEEVEEMADDEDWE